MAAEPIQVPENGATPITITTPGRMTQVTVTDDGLHVTCDLTIPFMTPEVVDAVRALPLSEHPRLLRNWLTCGATVHTLAEERSALDVSRSKLVESTEQMRRGFEEWTRRLDERDAARDRRITEALGQLEQGLTRWRSEAQQRTELDTRLRAELRDGQADVAKAAAEMKVGAAEVVARVGEAAGKLSQQQEQTTQTITTGLQKGVHRLLDAEDPTSAPALIKGVTEAAVVDLRTSTERNLAQFKEELTAIFGPDAPIVARIVAANREHTQREIALLREQFDKFREELIVSRTRSQHDPNVRGDGNEDELLALLGDGVSVYGWSVEPTGRVEGDEAGSKKGDHLIRDERDEPVAAVEARARRGVSAPELYKGMLATARNRGVKIVFYAARTEADLPTGLGQFSRGRVPLHYKQLTDGVHVLVGVADPSQETVLERLALVLWVISQLHEQTASETDGEQAAARIEQALPCVAQLERRLRAFRAIKGGLTKSAGEIEKTRGRVQQLEVELAEDVARLQELLAGDTAAVEACDDEEAAGEDW